MDLYDQGNSFATPLDKMSDLYNDLPQPQPANAKTLEGRTQINIQGAKGKAVSYGLAVRPKSEVLPSYTHASKHPQTGRVEKSLPHRSRQIARGSRHKYADPNELLSAAHRGKTTKQTDGDVQAEEAKKDPKPAIHPCQITETPAAMFGVNFPPTVKRPFRFSGAVSGSSTLEKCYINGEKPLWLGQPIASGDWKGAIVCVCTLAGYSRETFRLFGKVTWGELLERVHELHPTGTNYDLGREDYGYWEFFKIEVSLMYSQLE